MLCELQFALGLRASAVSLLISFQQCPQSAGRWERYGKVYIESFLLRDAISPSTAVVVLFGYKVYIEGLLLGGAISPLYRLCSFVWLPSSLGFMVLLLIEKMKN